MKTTIHSFSDLQTWGINLLTGESDALSRRLLCDVTIEGKNLVMKALGVPDISLPRPWNGAPAIGSILLDRETLRTLCILALFENPATLEVWESDDGYSFNAIDADLLQRYKESGYDTDNYKKYRIPERGSRANFRNEHQFTGRIS